MPAIDPHELIRQINEAMTHVDDSQELLAALRNIFSYYSDRTRRPAAVLNSSDTIRSFGSPEPVVRQVRRALINSIEKGNLNPADQIQALWSAEQREIRLVAIGLIKLMSWQAAVHTVENLMKNNRDRRVVEAISRLDWQSWPDVPDEARLQVYGRWLASDSSQLQQLSLLILVQLTAATSATSVPLYFDMLAGQADRLEPSAGPLFRQVIGQLAHRNPAETAQFLLDEARGSGWSRLYRRLIDDCLDAFPPLQRAEIEAALMAQ